MKQKLTWILCLLFLGLMGAVFLRAQNVFPQIQGVSMSPLNIQGTIPAPDFPTGDEWFNVDHPLTLKELRGKVVLLDFWTFCCINCMHVIPDLKRLEKKFPTQLVIIGVHSAKFTSEKNSQNIRNAILRYEVYHPVVNDANLEIWDAYGINAWPSFVLIDPEGKVVGITSGEGVYDTLEPYIEELVKHYQSEGKLNLKPIPLALEKNKAPVMPLSFPGKIAADEKTDTLVISDSDHNRILVTTLEGHVKDVIGGDSAGFKDGNFQTARFFRPQGVYYDPPQKIIYVADTNNHAIRKIDLVHHQVETLAGTGHQSSSSNREGVGIHVSLNSPWDLVKIGNRLYIAMAGSHQIWTLNLKTLVAKVYAGSGEENIIDSPDLEQAALAQTSGITTDGHWLYFVDSETSSLRRASLPPEPGGVTTLIGKGLFVFGDRDGEARQALLQHPVGITWHQGLIYLADTYNNKIKCFNPHTGLVTTLLGGSRAGYRDGPAAQCLLNEPCGLCFAGQKLFIADTNNNLIRVYDTSTGEVSTLTLTGLQESHPIKTQKFDEEKISFPAQKINPEVKQWQLEMDLPRGCQLNALASSRYEISSSNLATLQPDRFSGEIHHTHLTIPLKLTQGQAQLTVTLHVFYCSHGTNGLCFFKEVQLILPVSVTPQGESVFKSHLTLHS